MKTKTASKPSEKKEQYQQRGRFTSENLIKEAFRGTKGRIDIRFLWVDGDVHRFRVNCWIDSTMHHSEFVRVIEEDNKLIVRREHDKQ